MIVHYAIINENVGISHCDFSGVQRSLFSPKKEIEILFLEIALPTKFRLFEI